MTNRPAVLTIKTPAKYLGYITLVGLGDRTAWVKIDGGLQEVALGELGEMWTGEYTIAWKKPDSFSEVVGVGSKEPFVAWLAKQFAILDGQDQPITHTFFNEPLKKRVVIFQRKYNLEDDGFVGLHTLLKLNEITGTEVSLDDVYSSLVSGEI